jgi:hypothetical protein
LSRQAFPCTVAYFDETSQTLWWDHRRFHRKLHEAGHAGKNGKEWARRSKLLLGRLDLQGVRASLH